MSYLIRYGSIAYASRRSQLKMYQPIVEIYQDSKLEHTSRQWIDMSDLSVFWEFESSIVSGPNTEGCYVLQLDDSLEIKTAVPALFTKTQAEKQAYHRRRILSSVLHSPTYQPTKRVATYHPKDKED